MEKKLLLAPSMGCCDLYEFEKQVRFIDEHADFLHIDIKDGNYVKTFGVGPDFMTVLGKVVKKPMDAHLMVKHPQDYIEACAEAGASISHPIQTVSKVMLLLPLIKSSLLAARRESH